MEKLIMTIGAIPSIYDYVREGENEEKALESAVLALYQEAIEVEEYAVKYPKNAEYWKARANEYRRESESAKIVTWEEFQKIQRDFFISEKPVEVSEEDYYEHLDVLPPIHYISRNGFTMFCMSEMYTGTYTTQYARDNKTGKYYCLTVDVTDPETWIYNRI